MSAVHKKAVKLTHSPREQLPHYPIGTLAGPLCKVSPFPQQSKISFTGHALEDLWYNLSNQIVWYYWPLFVKKNIYSDQMALV